MLNYEERKKQALQILRQVITVAQDQRNPDQVETLRASLNDLQTSKLVVVVCGEFKRGKSSFINALLNEINLCPVDIDITTSLVTLIEYGERERLSVTIGQAGQSTTSEKVLKNRAEIADYVTEIGNPHNQRNARLMQIQLANAQLKSGLVLVDTPGVGGLNKAHTSITHAFLPGADVVIFVSDALTPLNAVELSFLQERVTPHCQHLLFVVTKKDKNEHYQDIVESNRQKLADILKCPLEEIVIIPVSNLAKKAYLTSQDNEDLQESNFAQLETYLWHYLQNGQGTILLLKAFQALTRTLAELRLPVQSELLGCQEQDRQTIENEKQHMYQMRTRLQELLDKNAGWQYHLQDELDSVQTQILAQLRNGFILLRNDALADLDNQQMREDPSRLVDQLQQKINDLLIAIYDEIGQAATQVHNLLREETGLNLNPYQNLADPAQPVSVPAPTNEHRASLWDRSLAATSGGLRGSSSGAAVLGLVGGIAGIAVGVLAGLTLAPVIAAGAALGSVLGSLFGFGSGVKRTLEQENEREKMALHAKFQMLLNQQEAHQAGEIRTTLKSITRTMRDDLTARLTRERRSVEESLQRLEQSSKLNQQQRVARIHELTLQVQQFGQWQSQVDLLTKEALTALEHIKDAIPVPVIANGQPAEATSNAATVSIGDWADE